jgi:hypothetical protein
MKITISTPTDTPSLDEWLNLICPPLMRVILAVILATLIVGQVLH